MLQNEKHKNQRLSIVLNNLDDNFIEDYDFWKRLVEDINKGLQTFQPDSPGFTYNEFCKIFKTELQQYKDSQETIDLNTIHNAVQQIMFTKISKKS